MAYDTTRHFDRYPRQGRTRFIWRTSIAGGTGSTWWNTANAAVYDLTPELAGDEDVDLRPERKTGRTKNLAAAFERTYVKSKEWSPVVFTLYDLGAADILKPGLVAAVGWLYVFAGTTPGDDTHAGLVGLSFDEWRMWCDGAEDAYRARGRAAEFSVALYPDAAPTAGVVT